SILQYIWDPDGTFCRGLMNFIALLMILLAGGVFGMLHRMPIDEIGEGFYRFVTLHYLVGMTIGFVTIQPDQFHLWIQFWLVFLAIITGVVFYFSLGRSTGWIKWTKIVSFFPILLWVRLLVGLPGGLLFNWMSWRALEHGNTQASTGILYGCIVWIILGEFSGLYLTIQTGVPL
ncbi:MAG: hypothetical protein ABEK50_04895, partial [bacterium]